MRTRLCYLLMTSFLLCGLIVHFATAEESAEQSRDAFRKLYQELRTKMDDDLIQATTYLESKIDANPDSADLNVLRHSLASEMAEQREYKQASEQFSKLLDFQIKHVADPENQFGIWMTIQSWQEVDENSAEMTEGISNGLTALLSVPQDEAADIDALPLDPIAQLTVLQAKKLASDDEEAAQSLIDQQLKALTTLNESDRATANSMQTLVRMLKSLTTGDRENDLWRDDMVKRLDETVTDAFERFTESPLIQNDFADTQLMMITRWGQDDPEATKKRIEEVTKKLTPFAIKNVSVSSALRRISLRKERMAAVKPVAKLVGTEAPEWDIDAWVNVIQMDRKDLKGKVVLLDFWAMWCGPCVATFPHLREWRKEFSDEGFEIVGVTSYYNYEWDDENKRASRSKMKCPPSKNDKHWLAF